MGLEMEDDKPPPYVQYDSSDASVQLVTADQALPQASPTVARRRRCTLPKYLAVALTICLMTTLAALTLLFLQLFKHSPKAEHLESTVLPDVTNLHLVSVGSNYFTAAWAKPKVNFDYYWIEVIGVNSHDIGVRPGTVGLCVNGTIIHGDQTQVTCSHLQPCSKVTFNIRTHVTGPPASTSHGVSLHDILIPASVPPEVTNLQLGELGADTFVLTWEHPETCFDYYTIKVTDERSKDSSIVTCNHGAVINPYRTSVTCNQTETCANVTIEVRTHTRGPPERSSTGLFFRGVFLQGKAPPEPTNLKLVSAKRGSFTVSFQAQRKCFDLFLYRVQVSASSPKVIYDRDCKSKGLAYNKYGLTCTGIETCEKVDFFLRTKRKGPPARYSVYSILRSIDIRGEC
uniref:Fibronectin type-III domain-containing protein n=1 Tax=Rhipicephalus zambeziensis TaxID=60191 RepID=A0A224Z1H4_9ACAR